MKHWLINNLEPIIIVILVAIGCLLIGLINGWS